MLAEKQLPGTYVEDADRPTGTVQVTLENGKPSYEICEGVAWDYSPMSPALEALAQRAAADETSDHPGCPGEAINSVGAGDSFTATMCMGLLNGKPLAQVNDHANRVATFVCSQDSATPVLSLSA